MEFGYAGINYKDAKQNIRDQIAFTDLMKIDFMDRAAEIGVQQCMVLSTCNRSEVFFFYEEESQRRQVADIYRGMFPGVDLTPYLRQKMGHDALEYLYKITAGLESLVLGEDQILGQVKDAFALSKTAGHSGKQLNKILRDVITCAKEMKTRLKISEIPLSVSYVGIKKVQELADLENANVLVIGSGQTAELALKYLVEAGAGHIYICNRTKSHARALSDLYEAEIVDFEDRYDVLQSAQVIVSATSAPHLIIRRDGIEGGENKIFLDLASPRDIERSIADMPGMTLINIDSIEQIVASNRRERARLIEAGKGMIETYMDETEGWFFESGVDATIESLQNRCEEIVEDSFSFLNRKMELSMREEKLVRKILRSSLHRLINEPIVELKKLDTVDKQQEYQKVVRELFQL